MNIAEEQGESTDAAIVFRESGLTPEEIAERGVNIKGRIAREGWGLSRLSDKIFADVLDGSLTPARGAVIGEGVAGHADQDALYRLMQDRERGGKRLTNDQVEELIRLANRTSTVTKRSDAGGQGGLFGEEEMTVSLLPEKAIVSDYVRDELRKEKKLFGAVSGQGAADRLAATGNVIKADANAAVAQEANQGIALYDKLSSTAGPIDGVLDRAAQQLANGENANDAKQQAYRAIRDYLTEQVHQLTGVPKIDDPKSQGLGEGRPHEAGAGQHDSLDARGTGKDDAGAAGALRAEVAPAQKPAPSEPLPSAQYARDLSRPLPPRANPEQVYSQAEWEFHRSHADRRPNRLRINESGFLALSRATHTTELRGVSMTPAQADILANLLTQHAVDLWQQDLLSQPTAKRMLGLADAIEQASGGQPVVIYRSDAELPLAERAQVMREEFTHWKQQVFGELRLPVATAKDLLNHRAYPLARHALQKLGYSDDPVEMANEIGAKLASGNFKQLNLSRRLALDFLDHYASTLTLRHGPEGAKAILRFIDASSRVRVHRAIARAALLPRRNPGGLPGAPPVAGMAARGHGGLGQGILAPAIGKPAGGTEVLNNAGNDSAGPRREARTNGGREEVPPARQSVGPQGAGGESVRGMASRGAQGPRGGVRPDVSPGLFGDDAERTAREDAERDRAQLLHDQLTAQIASGGAARPAKLKPAENRGLFEEAQPESGNLFGGEKGAARLNVVSLGLAKLVERDIAPWKEGALCAPWAVEAARPAGTAI